MYKGYLHYCSADDPQYGIRSDKTSNIAMHKGSAQDRVDVATPATIVAIGHSTRTLQEFPALPAAYSIEAIADVHRYPS